MNQGRKYAVEHGGWVTEFANGASIGAVFILTSDSFDSLSRGDIKAKSTPCLAAFQ